VTERAWRKRRSRRRIRNLPKDSKGVGGPSKPPTPERCSGAV